MNKTKHNCCLIVAIVAILLLAWGNISAQATMPVTIAFDVVGNLNGFSLNTDSYANLRAFMYVYSEDGSWGETQQLALDISQITGDVSYHIDWHPTASYDLVLGQKYYFRWILAMRGRLMQSGGSAGQFDWNLSGVGSSAGALWMGQEYEALSSISMRGWETEYASQYSHDPQNAMTSVSLHDAWLNSSARFGSSLLNLAGHVEMPTGMLFCDFDSWANGTALIQPIPEPASLALLGAGVLGLGVVGWYRRRRTV